jgi:hypothetical protein
VRFTRDSAFLPTSSQPWRYLHIQRKLLFLFSFLAHSITRSHTHTKLSQPPSSMSTPSRGSRGTPFPSGRGRLPRGGAAHPRTPSRSQIPPPSPQTSTAQQPETPQQHINHFHGLPRDYVPTSTIVTSSFGQQYPSISQNPAAEMADSLPKRTLDEVEKAYERSVKRLS